MMMKKKSLLTADIKRLTLHDGPGIRTTVFVKGCPLHCLWCHNPETMYGGKELLFREKNCVNCARCENVCLQKVHFFQEGKHCFRKENCIQCGKCTQNCWYNALEICGKEYKKEELSALLLKDKSFFQTSGGGVTFSGGEPLLYAEFIAEILKMLQKEKIHCAIDSCGYIPFEAFEKVLPFTDLFLLDLKGMDEKKHIENTGVSNKLIHENLRRLASYKVPVEIRMPVIPLCNDAEEEFHAAGRFLKELPNITTIRLLPYHDMAREKYRAVGKIDTMPRISPPDEEELKKRAGILRKYFSGKIC